MEFTLDHVSLAKKLESRELESPNVARLLLNPQFVRRKKLLQAHYRSEKLNDVIQLLSARSVEIADVQSAPPVTSFEACDEVDKLRIVLAEYLKLQEHARQSSFAPSTNPKLTPTELFDNAMYFETILSCLYALLIKTISIPVVNLLDMAESFLHIKLGSYYIIGLIANMPDRCYEVCQYLITSGDRQDETTFNEISIQRAQTLRRLCQINPPLALTVRATTLQLCKMPSLTMLITLDKLELPFRQYKSFLELREKNSKSKSESDEMDIDQVNEDKTESHDSLDQSQERNFLNDVEESYDSAIAFITGVLLGVDEGTSSWFAQYTKFAQQKRIDHSHPSSLSFFRSIILQNMAVLFPNLLDNELVRNSGSDKSTPTSSLSAKQTRSLNRELIRATATLKFFCALRGIGSIKLNGEEADILLRLITCRPIISQMSINFATTGVCTLLACSALINNQKEEKIAADWLKWLIKESNYSDTEYSTSGKCSISELLLLIAIHFQNNQTNQIAELVCTTLGMKLQIKASVSNCKSMLVQEVFNDQMIAEHAVRVPVTKNLDNSVTQFLPIHCVHQLLESRSFSKHQVPINEWIYKQICESRRPLHHMLPKLVKAYVNSVIVPTSSHGHCGTNQPLLEEDIAKIFETQLYSIDEMAKTPSITKRIKSMKKSDGINGCVNKESDDTATSIKVADIETSQVLLLYYLLLYDDTKLKCTSISTTERASLLKYDPDLMMDIPIFYLLQVVRDNQDCYGPIFPDLLKLVTSRYPQLCSIQHWLTIDNYEPYHSRSDDQPHLEAKLMFKLSMGSVGTANFTKKIKDNLSDQLNETFLRLQDDPKSLIRVMENILSMQREEIWPFVGTFIANLHKVVELDVSERSEYRGLIRVTTKLWWKFNTVFPRKLWVLTVNAIKKTPNKRDGLDVKPFEHTWDELAIDPLIVLRCDDRIYRCADFLNIFLHILSAFLAASKRCLQDQIHEQPGRQKEYRNLEELRTTLILAQTSAAIQILLESCTPSEEEYAAQSKQENGADMTDRENFLLERLNSSVNCICEHLHQVFIADTNLAKLVHFQTYASSLLPTTCEKIPSMHICLDFIPELLSQPDLSKQVFVVELTSYLCEKYAITKSLNVAKLCFNVAYTLLQLLPSERRALFYIPVLPALLRICRVFPILREDAGVILSQINQITLAHMASTPSRLSLGASKPFEGLDKMSWREVRILMNSLGLHEALYLCIQKCTLDLRAANTDAPSALWVKPNQFQLRNNQAAPLQQ